MTPPISSSSPTTDIDPSFVFLSPTALQQSDFEAATEESAPVEPRVIESLDWDFYRRWADDNAGRCERPTVESHLHEGSPLEIVLPSFPFKHANQFKDTRRSPAMPEVLCSTRLYEICRAIKSVYPPGARFVIIADGQVYHPMFGITRHEAVEYREETKRLISQLGYSEELSLADMQDLVDSRRDDFDRTHSERPRQPRPRRSRALRHRRGLERQLRRRHRPAYRSHPQDSAARMLGLNDFLSDALGGLFARAGLRDLPGIEVPEVPVDARPSWYASSLRYRPEQLDGLSIDTFIQALTAEGCVEIDRPGSTCPLNLYPLFQNPELLFPVLGARWARYRPGQFPHAEELWRHTIKITVPHDDDMLADAYVEAVAKVTAHHEHLLPLKERP